MIVEDGVLKYYWVIIDKYMYFYCNNYWVEPFFHLVKELNYPLDIR